MDWGYLRGDFYCLGLYWVAVKCRSGHWGFWICATFPGRQGSTVWDRSQACKHFRLLRNSTIFCAKNAQKIGTQTVLAENPENACKLKRALIGPRQCSPGAPTIVLSNQSLVVNLHMVAVDYGKKHLYERHGAGTDPFFAF